MEIYNTTWWGNAIDTAITAGTEPDFFGSQMKMLTSQQPEEVTNGDFATDSNWNKGTGWSIGENKAVLTNVGYNINCIQSNVTTIGQYYKIEFTILDYISGQIRIALGGNATSLVSANGTYVFYLQATINNVLALQPLGGSGTNLSITNVSLKIARAEEVEAVKCLADWIHTTALQDLNN